MDSKKLQLTAWTLSTASVLAAVIAWGQLYQWRLGAVSTYQWFPLLGLLAFSLMWAHYIAAAMRVWFGQDKGVLKQYFEITSWMVLVMLLLHPGLLVWELWRDGVGLPPGSLKLYTGTLYGAVILGGIAWLAFMAYEFRRQFQERSWWKYVQYASDAGMVLVFIHSLRLGSHLRSGWLRGVWYFYAATFLAAVIYMYAQKFRAKSP